jgi:hypothetical protein
MKLLKLRLMLLTVREILRAKLKRLTKALGDTALRAYNELKAAADAEPASEETSPFEGDPGESGKAEAKPPSKIGKLPTEEAPPPKAAKKAETADVTLEDLDPELQPPERLSQKSKVVFNNLPKTLKREFHKAIKDVEAGGSHAITEARNSAARQTAEVQSIRDAVQPFAKKWADRGFSVPQGIMQLASAQEKLTDPRTKVATYAALGRDLGIKPEDISAILSGKHPEAPVQQDPTQHPQIQALLQKVQSLESQLGQQSTSAAIKPVVDEIESVRREVDQATGQLKYPELHDEAHLESLKTRVTEIVGHDPNISLTAALLQANAERKQKLFGYSAPASLTTRIPASPQANTRVQQAAVSVRGRSSTGIRAGNSADAPPEALKNAKATTQWVLENLRRGTIS